MAKVQNRDDTFFNGVIPSKPAEAEKLESRQEQKTIIEMKSNKDIKKSTALVLTVLLAILSIVNACKKEEKNEKKNVSLPTVNTNEVEAITDSSATSGGEITDNGGDDITGKGVCWSTESSPTIEDGKTTDGTGTSDFVSTLTKLKPNTVYHVRAYAVNSKGTSYGDEKTFTTSKSTKPVYGTSTDQEGTTVKTVQIGTQIWFAENLKVTKYNDGTAIPNVTDNTVWSNLSTGAYCNYNNDATYATTYGRLYNWYAVNTGKLCPTGWHVPSSAEWTTLQTYLIANGYNYDSTTTGNKIAKSMASTTGWQSSTDEGAIGNNPSTNNSSGFTALPGGARYDNGAFGDIGNYGYWWSSTELDTYGAYHRSLNFNSYSLSNYNYGTKVSGFSVRCLRN